MHARLAAALTAAATIWALVLIAAPAAVSRAPLLSAAVYEGSARICHQRPDRSFHIAGVQMPVCARCAGLYVTGALGALLGWVITAKVSPRARQVLLLAAAAPTAGTWMLEFAGVMPFSNMARALAAVPLGIAAGWLFVQMLRYDAHLDGVEIHDSRPRARSL